MRGSSVAALAAPLAAVILLACGSQDAPPAAEPTEIDRALSEAERDHARAKQLAGRTIGG